MFTHMLSSFAHPVSHQRVAEIIMDRATNPRDVRDVAIEGLELDGVERVLELGCGCGFFSEKLAAMLGEVARYVGVDYFEENGPPFLERIGAHGIRGEFVDTFITGDLPWTSGSFDLVVASYCLYFFSEAIPDIARVLAPEGTFLTITHSPSCFTGLLDAAGIDASQSPLKRLVRAFSSDNGLEQLSPWFEEVDVIHYPNALVFEAAHIDDFVTYALFKLPQLLQTPRDLALGKLVIMRLCEALNRHGRIEVDKTDACFVARRPRWQ